MEVTKEIYSEVYSILNLLGDSFIDKLPKQLYSLIQKEKSDTYNPTYNSIDNLKDQDIRKESISMIALFHLNYWCNDDEEKQSLKDIFERNEEKHQAEYREKYSVDNLFKRKNEKYAIPSESSKETYNSATSYETVDIFSKDVSMVKYKEESFIKKIINKIKSLFKK